MKKLTHTSRDGKAMMVDVSDKESTDRTARAQGIVHVSPEVYSAITDNTSKKGDVLAVAKIAGIQAAKKTSEMIPLCHNIFISKVDLNFELKDGDKVIINSFAKTNAQTGIEMEALTAVSIAALTVYDMCKAIDKSMRISDIRLISKSGGKSGNYLSESV